MAGTIERAYQLAPKCETYDELRGKLKRQGCSSVDEHLSGNSIGKDLTRLLKPQRQERAHSKKA